MAPGIPKGGVTIFEGFKVTSRVEKLEDELAKLKRVVEERDLDWIDMRARCKRLLDRTRKYAEAVDAADGAPQLVPDNGGVASPRLSGRAAEVQQRILQRRARLMGGGGQ